MDQTNPRSGRDFFVRQHRNGKNMASKRGEKSYLFSSDLIKLGGRARPNDRAPTLISNAISGSGSLISDVTDVTGMIDAIEV